MPLRKTIKKFKTEWESLNGWPNVPRRWTKVKKVLRPTLLLIGFLIAVIPYYFQQASIERVYEGIAIPSGPTYINLNFSHPPDVEISLPYSVRNDGFYHLVDINLKVTLKLDYIDKNSNQPAQVIILSKGSGHKTALAGQLLNDTYYKDTYEFDWSAIAVYLLDADGIKPVTLLMDIEFSFYMAGVERNWLIITDIDLTSDIDEARASSAPISNRVFTSANFNVETPIHSSINFLSFILISVIVACFITSLTLSVLNSKKKEKKLKSKDILKNIRRKDPLKRENFKKALLKISAYATVIFIWDVILLFGQLTLNMEGINMGDFNFRYTIATISSIILLIITSALMLLPALKPRSFSEYSVKRGVNSLAISVLSLLGITIWATTSIISYNIEESVTFIRDTFPSFIPFIIFVIIYVSIKFTDLAVFSKYKTHFQLIRVKHEKKLKSDTYKLRHLEELNLIIFKAIKSKKNGSTISQIKKYFSLSNKARITRSGVSLNSKYLNNLVIEHLLVKKKGNHANTSYTYHLTPVSAKILKKNEVSG